MADRLSYDDLAEAPGCKHRGGPVRAAVLLAVEDIWTPALRQAFLIALQNRLPNVTVTPRLAALALIEWCEVRLEGGA